MNAPQRTDLTPAEVKKRLDEKSVLLIDVREQDEYDNEHIEGSILLPLSRFAPHSVPAPADNQIIVFLCAAGIRSAMAVAHCLQAGSAHNAHMEGGMQAWKRAGLPTI